MEERFFKCTCEIVNCVMKETLEKYNEVLMKSMDKSRFRNKGKERTSIKTKTGIVEYERTRYIEKKEEQLKCGEKYTPAIFQEADGIMIVMQVKDRKIRKKI